MSPDKYMILAQILRWAQQLDHEAESLNTPAVATAREMRRFVKATIELEDNQ